MSDNKVSGKIQISLALAGALFMLAWFSFNGIRPGSWNNDRVKAADTATTTLKVLNTPPEWSVDAQEYVESSIANPTNVGSNVVWVGTATDPNSEPFYLIICKTSSTPTAAAGSAPTCAGGAGNQWAVSLSTNSGVQATSTYTAQISNPENNPWFAFVCDANAGTPSCNSTYKQGTGNGASPFVVNHSPRLDVATDNSPQNPGAIVTWTTSSTDPDSYGGQDTFRLWVCKSNDFTGTACGGAGTYCSSTLTLSNASCSSTMDIPKPDGNYTSYAYLTDEHNYYGNGSAYATNTVLSIANTAPSIASSSIVLENFNTSTPELTLTGANSQTYGFRITFVVSDDNSCQTQGAGNEIASNIPFIYRSGVGLASCQDAGQYNTNNCYPGTVGAATWAYSCSQDAGTCSGPGDYTANFTCTYPLWYNTDPTVGTGANDTQYFSQNWLGAMQAVDNNGATSSITESSAGIEIDTFMAYQMTTPTIAYGELSTGTSTPIFASTTFRAVGNVGLDQTLYGLDMCTTFPSCNSGSTTSTIPVTDQRYATSATAYSNGISLAYNPGAELELNVFKTTATSSPANKQTYWGINVPITLTLSGDYTGQNTFIGVKSEATEWQ